MIIKNRIEINDNGPDTLELFYAFGQKQERNEIKLRLMKISDFKKIRAPISVLGPVKIWGSGTTVNSILWSISLEKRTNDLSKRSNTPSISIPEKKKGQTMYGITGWPVRFTKELGIFLSI